MENATISPSVSITNASNILLDVLKVIGMEEVANNVFMFPKKKK